jgi:hypothetical protein
MTKIVTHDDQKCRIEVQIDRDAYLSGAETASTDSDITVPTFLFETEEHLANKNIKMLLVKEIFQQNQVRHEVTEDQIKVVWSEESS